LFFHKFFNGLRNELNEGVAYQNSFNYGGLRGVGER
jgi:hypothetical protein